VYSRELLHYSHDILAIVVTVGVSRDRNLTQILEDWVDTDWVDNVLDAADSLARTPLRMTDGTSSMGVGSLRRHIPEGNSVAISDTYSLNGESHYIITVTAILE